MPNLIALRATAVAPVCSPPRLSVCGADTLVCAFHYSPCHASGAGVVLPETCGASIIAVDVAEKIAIALVDEAPGDASAFKPQFLAFPTDTAATCCGVGQARSTQKSRGRLRNELCGRFPNDAFVEAAHPTTKTTGGQELKASWIIDHKKCPLQYACVDEQMRRRIQQYTRLTMHQATGNSKGPFKARDKVTWTRANDDVPAGAVGIEERASDAASGQTVVSWPGDGAPRMHDTAELDKRRSAGAGRTRTYLLTQVRLVEH